MGMKCDKCGTVQQEENRVRCYKCGAELAGEPSWPKVSVSATTIVPVDGMAIASIVCGAVGVILGPVLTGALSSDNRVIGIVIGCILGILAVVTGIAGGYNISRSLGRKSGKLLVTFGIILGLVTVFLVVVIALSADSSAQTL
jgi:CDP-diglyceride synthetase